MLNTVDNLIVAASLTVGLPICVWCSYHLRPSRGHR